MIEALAVYIPMDRRQALARREELPDRMQGSALFADISGFTPLTEALVRELGPQKGAEELARHLDLIYDALIGELHRFGGSVIGFSGDAITCWLDGDPGLRAATCALAMQRAVQDLDAIRTASGPIQLAMKAAVATGPVRRFLVGDANYEVHDVIAGRTLDQLAAGEHLARKGEVILSPAAAETLADVAQVSEWRADPDSGQRFAVLAGLAKNAPPQPWPPVPAIFSVEQARPWLLPPVYERLLSGQGEFLSEFRPVVLLFLRFSGIDYDYDPQAGKKLDAYIRWVQSILTGYDGYLVQLTIGDKGSYLCAAFGAPVAHEDDATRATSVALALRRSPAELDMPQPVQIGIAWGQMRTGAYGGRFHRTYGIIGDEINLAARLMQSASPGQILASRSIYLSVGDSFVWEQLPEIQVKGKTDRVAVYSLNERRERPAVSVQAPRYAVPMVGRQAERKLVQEKLMAALAGRGQVVGITAEAGMGKTRLIASVVEHAIQCGMAFYEGETASYGLDTSYLVWQSIWRSFFGLDLGSSRDEQIDALQQRLEEVSPGLSERLPLLSPVINLPIPDTSLTKSLDAKLRKASLESLLVDCLRMRASQQPVLIVLEDCQWLDTLSHDLLAVIGRAVSNLPVMLLLAYRPMKLKRLQVPRVSTLPYFTEIQLNELTLEESEQLVRQKIRLLFDNQATIHPVLLSTITARAEGNPFYIEELLNYLRDQGIDVRHRDALQRLDLPASLHSLILSRIDQLSENQVATLKVASAIGRLFRAKMLCGVYPPLGTLQEVVSNLNVLNRLDLTALESAEPELTYLFKHILTQEVTYSSLPYDTREGLHEAIGAFIEITYPDALDQWVDLLAYHYENSGREDKKREYLLKAGQAAQANYSNSAAIRYYQKLLPLLPPGEQIGVLLKLGQVLELVGEWDQAKEQYQRALGMAVEFEDRAAQAQAQVFTGELLRKQGQYVQAAEWLERARLTFEELDNRAGVGQVYHYSGTLAAQQGAFEEARRRYEDSLKIRMSLDDRANIASLLSNLGIVARYQGKYSDARSLHVQGLQIRRELGDRLGIAISLNNLGNVALDQGDYAEARSRLEEAVLLYREVGSKPYLANSLNNLGNVARIQGDIENARRLYHESLSLYHELGESWGMAYIFEDIGCLLARGSQPAEALKLVGAAAALREKIGAPLSETEREKLEGALEPARQALDSEIQQAAWQAGYDLSLEEAVEVALARCEVAP